MNIFLNRRKKLLNKIKDGIIIIPSAELKQRSNDTEYPFRQNSNYFYLTGFKEQNSVLVLSKKGNEVKQIMFLEKKVPEMELWTGKRLGEKEAPRKLLVDEAYPIEEFQRRLELLLNGFKRIYISAFTDDFLAIVLFNLVFFFANFLAFSIFFKSLSSTLILIDITFSKYPLIAPKSIKGASL